MPFRYCSVLCRPITLTTYNIFYALQPTIDNSCGVRSSYVFEIKGGNNENNSCNFRNSYYTGDNDARKGICKKI